jgi:hypothetical protein
LTLEYQEQEFGGEKECVCAGKCLLSNASPEA